MTTPNQSETSNTLFQGKVTDSYTDKVTGITKIS